MLNKKNHQKSINNNDNNNKTKLEEQMRKADLFQKKGAKIKIALSPIREKCEWERVWWTLKQNADEVRELKGGNTKGEVGTSL